MVLHFGYCGRHILSFSFLSFIYIAWEYFTPFSGTPGSDRPVSTFYVETEQQWEFLPSHPSWAQKDRKLLSSSGFPDI